MADEPPRVDMLDRPALGHDFDIPETPSTTGKEIVPYKEPGKINVTLPGANPNEPGEGFSAENRRRWNRQWGGRFKGIGSFLRMLGARSPIGRIAQGVLGVGTKAWNELSEEDKEKFLNFMRQPLTDKSGLEYLQEWLGPQPEQEVRALPHYPKYQPRLEKFIQNLPQRVWSNPEQLRGVFENAMKKGQISRDEFYYEGGSGINTWGSLPIEQRSLGNFLDTLIEVKKGEPNPDYDDLIEISPDGTTVPLRDLPRYVTSPAKQERFLKQITKQDLLDVVRQNPLGITEREFAGVSVPSTWSDDYARPDPSKTLTYPPSTRWTMKGGHSYKETLLNLSDVKDDESRNEMSRILHSDREGQTLANNLGWLRHHIREIFPDKGGPGYVDRLRDKNYSPLQTTQLDEAQIDVRFLEGFPLKDKFMEIAARRIIRQAIEDGSDYITWTSGDEQARRNNQAFYINSVNVRKRDESIGGWHVSGGHFNGETDQMMGSFDFSDDELDEAFGKKWADKIRRDATKQTTTIGSPPTEVEDVGSLVIPYYENAPVEVYSPGGVRKLRLYNNNDLKGKMVNIFNKLGKKFGTKVEWKRVNSSTGQVDSGDDLLRTPAFKITPELRKFYSTAPIKLAQGGLVDKPLYEDSGTRYG